MKLSFTLTDDQNANLEIVGNEIRVDGVLAPGTYTLNFTVDDGSGRSQTFTQQINIHGALNETVPMVDQAGIAFVDTAGNRFVGFRIVDDPSLSLRQVTASQGIAFGTSIQGSSQMNEPGPSGFPTRMDWVSANVDLFVPGSVMMPDNFNTSLGNFDMSAVNAFINDARSRGKKWRGHCAYYPKRDIATWIDTYLQANPSQWQTLQHARIAALANVPFIGETTNYDVVNELFQPNAPNPGGWRTSPWTTASGSFTAPVVSAFQKMAEVLPDVPRYWCQDLSEQLASDTLNQHANNILAGIEACMNLGAPVQGFAMQAHLTYRLGFSGTRLRNFLRSLTETLGLKLIVSELDARTGYGAGFGDIPPPAGYSIVEYDRIGADLMKRFLDVALPFVKSSGGGQFLVWTLDDGYNSWTEQFGQPPGERPCPYDMQYQPKQQYTAIRNALLEL